MVPRALSLINGNLESVFKELAIRIHSTSWIAKPLLEQISQLLRRASLAASLADVLPPLTPLTTRLKIASDFYISLDKRLRVAATTAPPSPC